MTADEDGQRQTSEDSSFLRLGAEIGRFQQPSLLDSLDGCQGDAIIQRVEEEAMLEAQPFIREAQPVR